MLLKSSERKVVVTPVLFATNAGAEEGIRTSQ
jgi:hypothetical protein